MPNHYPFKSITLCIDYSKAAPQMQCAKHRFSVSGRKKRAARKDGRKKGEPLPCERASPCQVLSRTGFSAVLIHAAVVEREDARAEFTGGQRRKRLAINFHAAVDLVDEREKLRLRALGQHRRAELRLAVM